MVNIKFDFDDDMIAVDDHDRKRILVAAQDGGVWRVLEGPMDGPNTLSQRTTVETANQVLVDALQWLAESDD
ncbi:hypothetical protein [Natronorubrum bangense]|uniref:Uncharacterized protein n=2 Tax=Natronorubrum bangense TaxID=61858 RepID=L9WL61_9EURY|nr:hypothetical protein [Natronorubrum bangense]ELY49073.1 hypothetical protein C494_09079 [Natronorubrum bangense JCM 10635]QCC56471.1 hypothetical protein DV706_18305 [Natronorubrum bangense]